MAISRAKKKAKEFDELIGDFVQVRLKNMSILNQNEHGVEMTTAYEGYLLNVTEFYMYIGETENHYSVMIDIEEVGLVSILEDIPEELITDLPTNPGDIH